MLRLEATKVVNRRARSKSTFRHDVENFAVFVDNFFSGMGIQPAGRERLTGVDEKSRPMDCTGRDLLL